MLPWPILGMSSTCFVEDRKQNMRTDKLVSEIKFQLMSFSLHIISNNNPTVFSHTAIKARNSSKINSSP